MVCYFRREVVNCIGLCRLDMNSLNPLTIALTHSHGVGPPSQIPLQGAKVRRVDHFRPLKWQKLQLTYYQLLETGIRWSIIFGVKWSRLSAYAIKDRENNHLLGCFGLWVHGQTHPPPSQVILRSQI